LRSGVVVAAAVAAPPTGVDGELGEVGDPLSDGCRVDPVSDAPFQGFELIETHLIRALGSQVGVDERLVAELILGVVMDVLRHVAIELLKGQGVRRIPAGRESRQFVVWIAVGLGLRSAQFSVLQPQVAFDDLRRRQEPEDRRVSFGETATTLALLLIAKDAQTPS